VQQEVGEKGDEGGNIGPGGRPQYLRDRGILFLRLNKPGLSQNEARAGGGVELGRKNNQVKEHQDAQAAATMVNATPVFSNPVNIPSSGSQSTIWLANIVRPTEAIRHCNGA
jgi:hypothetical protein